MTQAEIENHTEIYERFIQHAVAEFENHDLPQASEKAWGAVAHYLKAAAKFRAWRNSSHSDLSDIADDLAYETDNPPRVQELYVTVNALHQNFYEDWLSGGQVARGIDAAAELISRLENRTGPEASPRPSQARRRR